MTLCTRTPAPAAYGPDQVPRQAVERLARPKRTLLVWVAGLVVAAASPLAAASTPNPAPTPTPTQAAAPLQPLASLDLSTYTGTWYQVAWFPNKFQRKCVSDTTAHYSRRDDGAVDVLNRCRLADGSTDSAQGLARPADAQLHGNLLQPARLQVSFLPAWLRWLPIWGDYWVIQMPEDGRYVIVSEGSRQYLWVLSRQPKLADADITAIRSRLLEQGFDLSAWTLHTHTAALAASPAEPTVPTAAVARPAASSSGADAAPAEAPEGRSRRPATPPATQTR